MDAIDKLLQQIGTEQTPKAPEKPAQSIEPTGSVGSVDNLLAQIESGSRESGSQAKPQTFIKPTDPQPTDFQDVNSQPVHGSAIALPETFPLAEIQSAPTTAELNLLAEVKARYAEEDRLSELKRQQQLQEERLREEQRQQKEREALMQEAQAWLKTIQPLSEEGLWFEEFSGNYESKLEAAIEYLQAVKYQRKNSEKSK